MEKKPGEMSGERRTWPPEWGTRTDSGLCSKGQTTSGSGTTMAGVVEVVAGAAVPAAAGRERDDAVRTASLPTWES